MGSAERSTVGKVVVPASFMAVLASVALLVSTSVASASILSAVTSRYIVSDTAASDSTLAQTVVQTVGGIVAQPLDAASAVVADLTSLQVSLLEAMANVTVTPDVTVSVSSTTTTTGRAPAAVYPQQTGATTLWSKGDKGANANVAVLDTGIDPLPDFAGRLLPGVDLSGEGNPTKDSYGHGTFVAGLIAGNGASSSGAYVGEAPGAGLVPVKVAGASGVTDLATVIDGVGWVMAHQNTEHISVLNLSLGYIPTQSSALNPLDRAVERAWDAGIVVASLSTSSTRC